MCLVHLCYYVDCRWYKLIIIPEQIYHHYCFCSNYIPFSILSCRPIWFKLFAHLQLIISSGTFFPFLEFPTFLRKKNLDFCVCKIIKTEKHSCSLIRFKFYIQLLLVITHRLFFFLFCLSVLLPTKPWKN